MLRRLQKTASNLQHIGAAETKQVQHKRCTIGRGNLRVLDRIPSRSLVLATCIAAIAWVTPAAVAHPGGLNKQGCHNDRKNGGYHCHRSASGEGKPTAAAELLDRSPWIPSTGAVFRNCAEARAAGAAPVQRGDPGYGPHLDRDHDGVGCEPSRRR
ncbi:excalibur calcium-binding domain-containing protein [Xanthomonas dyei]